MSNDTRLFSGKIAETARPGWETRCNACRERVRYTILKTMGVEPFLYCNQCSDFVLRAADAAAAARLTRGGAYPTLEQLRAFYQELQAQLPACLCGGLFEIGAIPKCPSGHALEEPRTEEDRYFATEIIWVDGALAFRGVAASAERLRVTAVRQATSIKPR
jgi:hypothetical protein